jgi:hypothetical protein
MASLFRGARSRVGVGHPRRRTTDARPGSIRPADRLHGQRGTLNLLQATRTYCPDATFVFISTNRVHGDRPNALPLLELETRLELPAEHEDWTYRFLITALADATEPTSNGRIARATTGVTRLSQK